MTDSVQLDAFVTPGSLLRAARERQGKSLRDVADQLKLTTECVSTIERDDFKALRGPAFARGYVRAYGRLLGLDERQLQASLEQAESASPRTRARVARSRPVQLQRTGLGVAIGLSALLLVVVALWWWEGGAGTRLASQSDQGSRAAVVDPPRVAGVGQ